MAGRVRILTALVAASALAAAFGQSVPDGGSTPAPIWKKPGAWLQGGGKALDGTPGPEIANVRRAIEALTPEQRKRFQENFLHWMNLSPEEKKSLRDREEVRKKFMQQEVEAAIQEAGLQLDGDRRELFVKRYGEERRRIEEQLRKETNEKRKPLVHDLIGRLKTEFSAPSSAASIQTPALATPVAVPQ